MKYPLHLLLCFLAFTGCAQNPSFETKSTQDSSDTDEKVLLTSIGFEPFVLGQVRKFTQSPISQLKTSSSTFYPEKNQFKTTTKKHKGF